MRNLKLGLMVSLLISLSVSQVLAEGNVVNNLLRFQPVGQLREAPDFLLSDLEGHSKSLDSYPGKLLLLHFWATWCEPCREELPALKTLSEKFRKQGLVVIAIAEDSKQAVTPFVKSTGLTLPVLIDQYGSALRAYRIKGLPTSYLVNKARQIEAVLVGQQDWESLTLIDTIEKILTRH